MRTLRHLVTWCYNARIHVDKHAAVYTQHPPSVHHTSMHTYISIKYAQTLAASSTDPDNTTTKTTANAIGWVLIGNILCLCCRGNSRKAATEMEQVWFFFFFLLKKQQQWADKTGSLTRVLSLRRVWCQFVFRDNHGCVCVWHVEHAVCVQCMSVPNLRMCSVHFCD